MAEVQLNRALNLVLTIDRDERGPIYVHSTPLARMVFEANFRIFARAFSALYTDNLLAISGPKVAALLLIEQAQVMGQEQRAHELLAEMRRLTQVIAPRANNGGGFETLPYDVARQRKIVDDDTAADVEGAIAFFTLASRVGSVDQRNSLLRGLSLLWPAEITSSTPSDFQTSLRTSTTAESTGPKPTAQAIPQSSIPS
jgi:hypothetical protein